MAKLIHASTKKLGAILEEVLPKNPPYFSLSEMQYFVGGYIEFIHLPEGEIMVIDDEGKLKGKDPNWAATTLAHTHKAIWPQDIIMGDALYCNAGEIDPN